MGPKLKHFEPLKVTPPSDLLECKISDNLEDSCKTLCKICAKPFNLTAMRSHTLSAHNLQITKYKEIHGQFEILQVVWHRCHICGKLVLMDSDALGGHIKGTHKMKEKDYKEQYCVYMQRSLTPRASENNELVSRKSMLKRKPSEQTQEELARPRKKLKGAILSKEDFVVVSSDLEREGSNVSTKDSRRLTEESGRSQTGDEEMQTEGSDQKRRKKPKKRIEKKIIADVEEEVAGDSSVETRKGSMSERRSTKSKESSTRILSHNIEASVDESLSDQEEKTADDEESESSEMETSFMKQMERMDRITNKSVEVLKKESRIFRESILGNRGVQMLGGNDREKPPVRNAYKASSSNSTNEGRSRAGLRKKIEENFDPFVDVEYDCNLKDCQDCGKVSLVIRLSQLEKKQIGKGRNLYKDSEVSDEEHEEVSDELLAEEGQTSDGGRENIEENIARAPVLEELCGGESSTDLKRDEEAEVGEVGRPLCTKQMPLLKETCLHSEVLSPSFDLTSESESSDDESNSSEDDEVQQETPSKYGPSKTSETENGEVEIMSGDKCVKGGWKKSGKGFVWVRGSSIMHNDEVVELQENGNSDDVFDEE